MTSRIRKTRRRAPFGSGVPLVLCVLSVAVSALAQRPVADATAPVPFARYVPASAKLFITVHRPGEADAALRRAHAWRLLPILAGGSADEGRPFNFREAIASFLGLQGYSNINELLEFEMGLVARSWVQPGGAVWLVRIPDEAVLDRWFPPGRRKGRGAIRAARFFNTRDGVTVCMRDGIVATARRSGRDSLLRQTMHLMGGPGGEVLERSAVFRELTAYLPVDPLAVAYVARDDPSPAARAESSPWWPALDRAVVGLYEGEGRIDVAIRASLVTPRSKPKLSRTAIWRLLRLPQTTLLASVTTIDLEQAYQEAASNPTSGTLGRYLALLAGVQESARDGSGKHQPRLGPHVILVWGQDLTEGGSTPQVAVMVECGDGQAVRELAGQIARRIVRLVHALDPAEAPGALSIIQSKHLGTPVLHIPLKSYARKSRLPLVRLLGSAEPAWTVWNGWLILALSRDHIARILDAQFGLVPTLTTLADVREMRPPEADPAGWAVLSIIQPGLATNVLDQWLGAQKAGSPSLLDPGWWRGHTPTEALDRLRLGIETKVVQEPGAVVVARVYPNTAAEGRLLPEDRIIGIDGYLLSLTSPNADLRKRWAESTAEPGPTLRVQRGGTAIDVVLPSKSMDGLLANVRMKPADAVRELASLGRTLQFASFAVRVSEEQRYWARLSLRFAPAHASEAAAR